MNVTKEMMSSATRNLTRVDRQYLITDEELRKAINAALDAQPVVKDDDLWRYIYEYCDQSESDQHLNRIKFHERVHEESEALQRVINERRNLARTNLDRYVTDRLKAEYERDFQDGVKQVIE